MNRDDFDLENAELRSGKPARAVVSVSLPRKDFEAIAKAAEQAGLPVSTFIRQAALEKACPTKIFIEVGSTTFDDPVVDVEWINS